MEGRPVGGVRGDQATTAVNNADLGLLVLRVAVGVVIGVHGFMKLGWVGTGGSPAGVAGWFDGQLGFKPGVF